MYSRSVKGNEYTFGVSGMLYKSNLLMYDRETESLWSQVLREALTGPRTGDRLEIIPSTLTTWEKWKKNHPDTEVLSLDTGYKRNYTRDPYETYYKDTTGFFALFGPRPTEEDKQLVAGVVIDGKAKAYPIDELRQNIITDTLGERKLRISLDPYTDEIRVQDETGRTIPHLTAFWFVWKGLHEGSGLWER